MKIFVDIKFHDDSSNKELIEEIVNIVENDSNKVISMARDYENWGKVKLEPKKLMKITFEEINKADMLLVEFSEKGVGLGIEAGYAYAKGIPIIVIAKTGSDISNTIRGIAKEVVFYKDIKGIKNKLKL